MKITFGAPYLVMEVENIEDEQLLVNYNRSGLVNLFEKSRTTYFSSLYLGIQELKIHYSEIEMFLVHIKANQQMPPFSVFANYVDEFRVFVWLKSLGYDI
jgi:hypothetical protein